MRRYRSAPHPATQCDYPMRGRVGERAGAAPGFGKAESKKGPPAYAGGPFFYDPKLLRLADAAAPDQIDDRQEDDRADKKPANTPRPHRIGLFS